MRQRIVAFLLILMFLWPYSITLSSGDTNESSIINAEGKVLDLRWSNIDVLAVKYSTGRQEALSLYDSKGGKLWASPKCDKISYNWIGNRTLFLECYNNTQVKVILYYEGTTLETPWGISDSVDYYSTTNETLLIKLTKLKGTNYYLVRRGKILWKLDLSGGYGWADLVRFDKNWDFYLIKYRKNEKFGYVVLQGDDLWESPLEDDLDYSYYGKQGVLLLSFRRFDQEKSYRYYMIWDLHKSEIVWISDKRSVDSEISFQNENYIFVTIQENNDKKMVHAYGSSMGSLRSNWIKGDIDIRSHYNGLITLKFYDEEDDRAWIELYSPFWRKIGDKHEYIKSIYYKVFGEGGSSLYSASRSGVGLYKTGAYYISRDGNKYYLYKITRYGEQYIATFNKEEGSQIDTVYIRYNDGKIILKMENEGYSLKDPIREKVLIEGCCGLGIVLWDDNRMLTYRRNKDGQYKLQLWRGDGSSLRWESSWADDFDERTFNLSGTYIWYVRLEHEESVSPVVILGNKVDEYGWYEATDYETTDHLFALEMGDRPLQIRHRAIIYNKDGDKLELGGLVDLDLIDEYLERRKDLYAINIDDGTMEKLLIVDENLMKVCTSEKSLYVWLAWDNESSEIYFIHRTGGAYWIESCSGKRIGSFTHVRKRDTLENGHFVFEIGYKGSRGLMVCRDGCVNSSKWDMASVVYYRNNRAVIESKMKEWIVFLAISGEEIKESGFITPPYLYSISDKGYLALVRDRTKVEIYGPDAVPYSSVITDRNLINVAILLISVIISTVLGYLLCKKRTQTREIDKTNIYSVDEDASGKAIYPYQEKSPRDLVLNPFGVILRSTKTINAQDLNLRGNGNLAFVKKADGWYVESKGSGALLNNVPLEGRGLVKIKPGDLIFVWGVAIAISET